MVSSLLKTGLKSTAKRSPRIIRHAAEESLDNWGWLTKNLDSTQSALVKEAAARNNMDISDPALQQRGLSAATKESVDTALDEDFSFAAFERRIQALDELASDPRVLDEIANNVSDERANPGIIKGKQARRIQARKQVSNPPTTRADSIQPNLPQEEIDLYIEQATEILRAGGRNRKDVGYLVDKNGEPFRLDQKGWVKVEGKDVKKYALISQRLKNARNAKLQEIRQQKVNITTPEGTDQKEFYADPDPLAQHKAGIEEPHHRAGLHPVAKLKEGLSDRESLMFDKYLEKHGILAGNSRFNRDNLPKDVHKLLHSWLTRHKLMLGKQDISELSLSQRKKFIDRFIRELKVADKKTYQLMRKKRRGDTLKINPKKKGKTRKKPNPTQFPEQIQRHIARSQEIGIPEPTWKSGSIDYTWRPETNTGQIDIPPQSAKGFKGLRDEFFEQIEELPSGSVWELNPKFKDEKRRRIYAKLFGNDPRITRNPDETLGWVLTIP